jgi:hypothetical protein
MKLRFTIRDLLWLAVLAAVCMTWWMDRAVIRREREHLLEMEEETEQARLDYMKKATEYFNMMQKPQP